MAVAPPTRGVGLLGEGLLVAALYAVITILLLQPLLSDPAGSLYDGRTVVAGDQDQSFLKDELLLAWIYAWGWHAIVHDPLALYDSNAFHPYPSSLAFSEHSVGKVLTAGVAFGLTNNAVLAHQIDLVLSFALSGAALYVFLRRARVARGAAWLAGLLFIFCPTRLGTLAHSHLLGWQYLPLALLFLQRTLQEARIASAIAFAGLLLVQCLCSYYLAYMSMVGVATFCVVFALTARATISRRGVALALLAGCGAIALFALLSWPYLQMRATGIVPRYDVDSAASQGVLRFLSNHPWRSYLVPLPAADDQLGVPSDFLGWLPLAVALLACITARAATDPTRRGLIFASLAVTLVGWSLSLGPVIEIAGWSIPLPYEALSHVVPGFSSMRVPGRFALLMMLGLASLVGFGLDFLASLLVRKGAKRRTRYATGIAFAAAIVLEYRLPSRTFAAYKVYPDGKAPAIYSELAKLRQGAVAEFPFQGVRGIDAAKAMVYSTAHWHPIVNGKSAYEPRGRDIVLALADGLPENPAFLSMFVRLTGVKYIVVHLDSLDQQKASAWLRMPAVRWVGRSDAGDLLGVVTLHGKADLQPLLLACAGYPSAATVGGSEACEALAHQLELTTQLGRRLRAPIVSEEPRYGEQ